MPTAVFKTLGEFHAELDAMGSHTTEYWDKQVHRVPATHTVDRTDYLVKQATGKVILHIGCTGPLDEALQKVAKRCYGMDKNAQAGRSDFAQCDLDGFGQPFHVMPLFAEIELIVCGEVLEHLSNPGNFLTALRNEYQHTPVIFTVPNAFSVAGQSWLVNRGRENVNKDHVCYYSYTTLTTLLSRAGYVITKHYWYNGKPCVSEGLIALAVPRKDH